jgi:hypothetical protein
LPSLVIAALATTVSPDVFQWLRGFVAPVAAAEFRVGTCRLAATHEHFQVIHPAGALTVRAFAAGRA